MTSLLILVLLAGAPPATAASNALTEQRALALELVELVQPEASYRSSIEQMMAQLVPPVEAQARAAGKPLPPDFKKRLLAALFEVAPYDEVMEWSSEIYAQRFTVAEIKQLIAFYKTPLGRKLSSKLPEIMGEAGKRMGTIMPTRLPEALKRHGIGPDGESAAQPAVK